MDWLSAAIAEEELELEPAIHPQRGHAADAAQAAVAVLAMRGKGAATLSTATNSNAINVAVGLLIPGTIVRLGAPSGPATLIAGG